MKILVYGINYFPELTGIGKYTGEMCQWLAARGHQVEVITSMPYYPEWKIHEKYRNKWWHSEAMHGVKILRGPFYVPEKITGTSRIVHELSFMISSFCFWFPRFFKKYDVVIGVCPPLQTGIFPLLYKVLRRKPFVFHVQDLQVDAARELGLIKNSLLLSLLQRVEKFLMRRATLVTTISQGMKKRLLQKGLKEEKIFLLPNWVDTNFIKPLSRQESLRTELGFGKDDQVVLYSGNMGDKQGLEAIINIAEKVKENTSLFFVLCGAGSSKRKLEKLAQEKGLSNICFLDVQTYEKLSRLLAIADIHLVLQKKAATDLVFPSKLLTILSAGGVSIVTASPNSELYEFIVKNNLGIAVEPENEGILLRSIVENINKDHSLIKENARRYAVEKLTINKILYEFEQTLSSLNRKI